MGKISSLDTLDDTYRYLPYCMCFNSREAVEMGEPKTYIAKAYPPYPWRRGTGDHIDEDPKEFIEACVRAGLVRWETAEDAKERLRREAKYVDPDVMYEEWKAKRETVKTMKREEGEDGYE